MNAMMGGTHYHTPQTIFQHMMGGQQYAQDSPQWMQIPQVPPISMPWTMQSPQSNVIRFGEDRPQPVLGVPLHQKRKLDPIDDMVDMRQTKQFITEEKMAAHFQDLHISTKSAVMTEPVQSTSTAFESLVETSPKIELAEDLDMEPPTISALDSEDTKVGPRLVISEEIKRLQPEPILPSSLLSKLERPTMALVLWEPPNKHLRLLSGPQVTPTPSTSSNTEDDNNNNTMSVGNNNIANNNNASVPNLNVMITEDETPVLEPMDL